MGSFLKIVLGIVCIAGGSYGVVYVSDMWVAYQHDGEIPYFYGLLAGVVVSCAAGYFAMYVLIAYLLWRLGKGWQFHPNFPAWVVFYYCVMWFYGALATPVTVYGTDVYRWFDNPSDPWALLPILALVPLIASALAIYLPNADDRKLIGSVI